MNTEHTKLSEDRLHVIEGYEEYIPKSGLTTDIQYYDYDSLVRMYGKRQVDDFILSQFQLG